MIRKIQVPCPHTTLWITCVCIRFSCPGNTCFTSYTQYLLLILCLTLTLFEKAGTLARNGRGNEARRCVCFSSSCDCENNGQISTSNCLGTMCVISPISRNLYRSQPYPALTIISLACSNYRCLVTTDTICTVMKIEELGTNCQVSMCTVLLMHFRVDLTSFGSHPTCRQP